MTAAARTVSIASATDSALTLAFGGADGKAYTLAWGYGAADGGTATNAWDTFAILGTVAADATSQTVPLPANWGDTVKSLRFFLLEPETRPYATRLEYIESTGTQWIDSGVNGETGLKFRADLAWDTSHTGSNANADWMLVGARKNTSTDTRIVPVYIEQTVCFGYGKFARTTAAYTLGVRHEIVADFTDPSASTFLYRDGTPINTYKDSRTPSTGSTINAERNLYIFAANWGGSANLFAKAKLYGLQIWRKNTNTGDLDPVRDYVPCKDEDGVACLYDLVDGRYFYNGGSQPFTAGAEIPLGFVVSATSAAHNWVSANTLVVNAGIPMSLSADFSYDAVLLRDTLTLTGGTLTTPTVTVDGVGGGVEINGGVLPSSAKLLLSPDIAAGPEYASVLTLRSGTTTLQCATNANPDVAARVLFSGGSLRGTSFSGKPFCAANGGKWILEGGDGADIVVGELGLQRIAWLTGSGSIETRGDCDVVLYDCQYNAANDYRGTVYLNTPNALWNHTGDLVLSNAIHVVCQADNCLPVGSQTGDIVFKWINRSLPAPLLDLNGHSVAVNGLDTAAGGIVTNSSASIATLRIGEDDTAGAVALPALSGGNIALAKRGTETNTVSLASSDLAALRVESGTLVVVGAGGAGGSPAVTAASVEVAEGATLVLDGVTLHASRLSGSGAVERLNGGDIDVAQTRFAWFAADAATDTATGGVWRAKPPLLSGAYNLRAANAAVFAAIVPQRVNPRVDVEFVQDGALPAAWLDDLLVDAVTNGVRARIVAVDDGGEDLSWRGLALVNGAPAWVRLEGAVPEPDAPCRIAAEFDFSGPVPLVSYLAGGSGVSPVLSRLQAASGDVWFPAAGSGAILAGRVEISGSGDLFALAGTTDSDALPRPSTVFFVQ
jgi:hypothetical protein